MINILRFWPFNKASAMWLKNNPQPTVKEMAKFVMDHYLNQCPALLKAFTGETLTSKELAEVKFFYIKDSEGRKVN